MSALAVTSAGCTTPRTELLVVVDTDVDWGPGKSLRSLGLTVRSDGPDGAIRFAQNVTLAPAAGTALPASFGVIPLSGDAQRLVWIEVRGCAEAGGCEAPGALIVQRAIVGFVPRETLTLQLFLAADCAHVTCDDPHQVCNAATRHCESAVVDATTLPVYDPDAGADASMDHAMDATVDAAETMVDTAPDTAPDVPPDAGPPRVTEVVAGDGHTCALHEDGTVRCWGSNTLGGLGTGSDTLDIALPTVVTGLTDAVHIGAGSKHTCAVRRGGTLVCWGNDEVEQLGAMLSENHSATPVGVQRLTTATQVEGGGGFTCARMMDGTVACWGWNNESQLGHGAIAVGAESIPANVPGITDATSVTAGDAHACALRAGGAVSCWGRNLSGQLGIGTITPSEAGPQNVPGIQAIDLAAGGNTTCAVLMDHTVSCWGDNGNLQLGAEGTSTGTPRPVPGVSNVAHITLSVDNACALGMDGSVTCWGTNETGEQGNGTVGFNSAPAVVAGVTGAAAVISGAQHHCALLLDGHTVTCWGSNSRGQLGRETFGVWSRDLKTAPGFRATGSLAAGDYFTCAVQDTGDVACVGSGATPNTFEVDTATSIPNAVGALQVAAGGQHACVLRNDATVGCWGYNTKGQLGDGMPGVDNGTASALRFTGGATFVAAGAQSSCAITAMDTECWGDNASGQLGFGQPGGIVATPIPVHLLAAAVQMDVGGAHACAVDTAGAVECWGDGTYGQIGNGMSALTPAPDAVSGLTATPLEVSLGELYSCARTANGQVFCWGYNHDGELGNGTTDDAPAAVAVTGITTATEISAGGYHACARLQDTSVWCWGTNRDGQLGQPMIVRSLVPVELTALHGAVHIAAGGGHTCGVFADQSVRCLGYDASGQYGAAVTPFEPVPTAVHGAP